MTAALAFLAALLVVIAGFWPSFYSHPSQVDTPRMVHGVIASVWMLIVATQPWLIVARQYRLHRLIGRFSIVWAMLLLAATLYLQHRLYAEPLNGPDPLPFRVAIGFINLTTLGLFAVLYILAIQCAFTRRIEAHSRYIACTLFVPVLPAVARLFGGAPGLPVAFGLAGVILLTMIVTDLVRRHRVYVAAPLTLVVLAVVFALVPRAADLAPYMAVARAMGYPN